MTLGKILKLFRIASKEDLSKALLSKEIGVSTPYISNIELGKTSCDLDGLKKFSAYYNVPVSEFIRISEISELTYRNGIIEVVNTYLKYNEG